MSFFHNHGLFAAPDVDARPPPCVMKRFLCRMALSLLVAGGLGIWWWSAWRIEHSQDSNILAATRRYGMDPALVKAVIWKESRLAS